MSDIQYIHNFTGHHLFFGDSEFTIPSGTLPSANPDEAIVRAITFRGDSADPNQYLIWCNLKNDYIASFCGGIMSTHTPQSRIWLNSPVPNQLEFKLYAYDEFGNLVVTATTGGFAIHLDFIKYRSIPSHA